MELKITTTHLLKGLQLLSWIIFIGLCVEAGAFITNTFISLFINPRGADNFWEGNGYLGSLFRFDRGHFVAVTTAMSIVAVLKATMFYLIVKLFTEKKLKLSEPFNPDLRHFSTKQSYLALGIGLFSYSGSRYVEWLKTEGMQPADLQSLHIAGADVWLFMAIVLFVIVQVVKKGIELQHENDLTI